MKSAIRFIVVILPLPFLFGFMIVHSLALFNPGYTLIDRFFASLLLIANIFFALHMVAYTINFLSAESIYPLTAEMYFRRYQKPRTAIFIACYNEPPEVVERTLSAAKICAKDIADVYLLDDSTNEDIRREMEKKALIYDLVYIHRENRRGFKAGAINDALKMIDVDYLAVLDADQRPDSDFLREIIPIMESDPKLAFLQVPQAYTNTDASRIALGAHSVQVVFFQYITEGKSVGNSMFSCGSNVIYRVSALKESGGFVEENVTEDFATSFNIHRMKWNSRYYNQVLVKGEGPSSLSAYFAQQSRWAIGTTSLFKKILLTFFTNPRALKLRQWWEYIISGSWFFVGWAHLIMILMPVITILFGIRPFITGLLPYLIVLIPYIGLTTTTFSLTVKWRGYPAKYVFLNIGLTMICFPICAISALYALIGKRIPFKVTPKGFEERNLPWRFLLPQLITIALLALTSVVGIAKFIIISRPEFLVNVAWSTYFLIMLLSLFYFNTGQIKRPSYYEPLFKPYSK